MGQGRNPLRAAALLCAALGIDRGCNCGQPGVKSASGSSGGTAGNSTSAAASASSGSGSGTQGSGSGSAGSGSNGTSGSNGSSGTRATDLDAGLLAYCEGQGAPSRWATDWSTAARRRPAWATWHSERFARSLHVRGAGHQPPHHHRLVPAAARRRRASGSQERLGGHGQWPDRQRQLVALQCQRLAVGLGRRDDLGRQQHRRRRASLGVKRRGQCGRQRRGGCLLRQGCERVAAESAASCTSNTGSAVAGSVNVKRTDRPRDRIVADPAIARTWCPLRASWPRMRTTMTTQHWIGDRRRLLQTAGCLRLRGLAASRDSARRCCQERVSTRDVLPLPPT